MLNDFFKVTALSRLPKLLTVHYSLKTSQPREDRPLMKPNREKQ